MNKFGRALVLLATITLMNASLAGCVSKILESKNAEPQIYVLKAGGVATAQVAYPVQISVALPGAAPGLDTNRIAVLRGNELDYYAGARWGATAPQVAQSVVIDTLHASGGFKAVVSEGASLSTEYLLEMQLKDFQAEYANANGVPTVRVTLAGALIEIKSRRTRSSLHATTSVVAADNRLGAVVTAFQSATQQATMALGQQLAASLAKP